MRKLCRRLLINWTNTIPTIPPCYKLRQGYTARKHLAFNDPIATIITGKEKSSMR